MKKIIVLILVLLFPIFKMNSQNIINIPLKNDTYIQLNGKDTLYVYENKVVTKKEYNKNIEEEKNNSFYLFILMFFVFILYLIKIIINAIA